MALVPLRLLVIGAGSAACHLHLPLLQRLQAKGEVMLACVCDLDRERAQAARRRYGFADAESDAHRAAARPDIDAVYIFGDARLHFALGSAALESGKHLFVEKPVAPSWQQAHQLADIATARGLVAVGGHNRRFFPTLNALRARHAAWRHAEAVFHKPRTPGAVPYGARSWLTANGIHALDALVFMMGGLPDTIAAQAQGQTFSALMRWPDGAQASFLCDNEAGTRREDYVFHAPGESCRATHTELEIVRDGKSSRQQFQDCSFAAEHDAFLDAIRNRTSPVHALGAIAPSLFLGELIESGFTGPVRLPESAQVSNSVTPRKSILVMGDIVRASAPLLERYRLLGADDLDGPARPDVVAALLGRGATALAPEQLEKFPHLQVVGFAGLSWERHEPERLLARGIALLNASDAYAESVAEMALGLAILARRRAFQSETAMRAGQWGEHDGIARKARRRIRMWLKRAPVLESTALSLWHHTAPSTTPAAPRLLSGSAVGLLGWGANARAFARRLQMAGAKVLVWSENAREIETGCRVSLSEALAADIVSLHRRLTPQTHHFLKAAELAQLRPGSILLNLARGALIEPEALLARLSRGDVFACLDSFEIEPLPRTHPLRRLPNVFLTPHIAGGSGDMHAAAAEEVVRKVMAWLDHERARAKRTFDGARPGLRVRR